ncbi:MAG: NAD(P)H-hydrate dehydratase [Candidatus Pacebacteria bacterium]|jgi:NAD(P)H-hydrate epimerase|nr:NAD(P)H-hydrate dehydratase [Candidatus Paceibacterota bacterium]
MAEIISKAILERIYPRRPEDSRKYDFGNLLVVGGSDYYSGAPALAALAAFAAGADMVRIAAPKRAADIIATFSPLLSTIPLEGRWLDAPDLCVLQEVAASMAAAAPGKCAVVIGGGIGRSPETMATVKEFVASCALPTVIDADAVRALADSPEIFAGKPLMITPHLREFYELTGNDVADKSDDAKAEIVANQAKSLGMTIVLKGKVDVISDGTRTALGRTGNALMTKGGTGDTLAGIAGALLARGVTLFESASAAAYINGIAGELAGAKLGESVTAMDLVNEIPNVLPKRKY